MPHFFPPVFLLCETPAKPLRIHSDRFFHSAKKVVRVVRVWCVRTVRCSSCNKEVKHIGMVFERKKDFFATIFLEFFCHGKTESSQNTTVSCLSLILSCLRRRYPIKNSAALHTLKSEFLSGTDSTALGTRSLAMNGTLMNNVGRERSMSARPRRANPDFSILFTLHSKKFYQAGSAATLGRSDVARGEGHTHNTTVRQAHLASLWPTQPTEMCGGHMGEEVALERNGALQMARIELHLVLHSTTC